MTPDDLIRKRARKIVDAGDVPKATLQESITLNEKVDALIEEVKKKELLEYDLQIDEDARLHLKGDKGDTGEKGEKGDTGDVGPEGKQGETGKQGPKGEKGKDGEDGVDGIDGKDGKDGKNAVLRDIKISDVKELPETIATLQNRTQLLNQMVSSRANSTSNITETSKTLTFNLDGSLNSCTDSVGSETIVYTVGIPSSVVGTGVYVNKTLTYTDTLDTITL